MLEVSNELPQIILGRQNTIPPPDLIGATIIKFGGAVDTEIEGGGLVINYQPKGSSQVKQLVCAFDEMGMWIDGNPAMLSTRDALR